MPPCYRGVVDSWLEGLFRRVDMPCQFARCTKRYDTSCSTEPGLDEKAPTIAPTNQIQQERRGNKRNGDVSFARDDESGQLRPQRIDAEKWKRITPSRSRADLRQPEQTAAGISKMRSSRRHRSATRKKLRKRRANKETVAFEPTPLTTIIEIQESALSQDTSFYEHDEKWFQGDLKCLHSGISQHDLKLVPGTDAFDISLDEIDAEIGKMKQVEQHTGKLIRIDSSKFFVLIEDDTCTDVSETELLLIKNDKNIDSPALASEVLVEME